MTRCSFCGKSSDDVRVILTRDQSAICDECVSLAFDTIGGQRGYFYQRVAYSSGSARASRGMDTGTDVEPRDQDRRRAS